jgi:UDP-hydrolysing UDP-N-acetyl-D-glucosamine 2-epimerase
MNAVNGQRRIAVVITYRGAYARLKTFLTAVKNHPGLELQLIVGASALLEKYGEAINVIEADGFEIAARVYFVLEGENPVTMAKTAGMGIVEIATALDNLKPAAVVVIGDRYESLGVAAAAAYMNIPVVHVQGGEVTGSIDEKVRHAITKLADLHLVATEGAAERVKRLGEEKDMVFVTGCSSIDLAATSTQDRSLDFAKLTQRYGSGPALDLETEKYLVVMQHPVTTEYEDMYDHIHETLMAVYELKMPTLWFWPNVDAGSDRISKGLRVFREKYQPSFIHFFKNMPPEIFYKVVVNSACMVGSSSVGIRETSYLGVPSVTIGTRQAGRERGPNVIDAGYDRKEILSAIRRQLDHGPYSSSQLYGDGRAGQRMASILADAKLKIEKRITY